MVYAAIVTRSSGVTPPPGCTGVGGSSVDVHPRNCYWGLLVLCASLGTIEGEGKDGKDVLLR